MHRQPSVVGVNLLWLEPGVVGGSEEYTLRLLRALDRLDPDDLSVRLYAQPALLDAHPDLGERFEVGVNPVKAGGKLGRIGAEHSWLASVSRDDDLVHHAGGVVPVVTSTPSVLTIHDLQPLDMPEHFSVAKRAWLSTMIPRSARAAERVMCPSEFSAARISDRLGISRDKITVVPHGYEPPEAQQATPDGAPDYGRFVLLPAIAYPHKRHVDLVDALDTLRDRFADLSVVMTGGAGPETERLRDHIAELGLDDRCHLTGRVSEDLMDHLFRTAAVMAFPSTYEGFGNPTLEAMSRGCPVVATTAAAIPEVVGEAGLLVEPGRPRALAAAIARVLDSPELAEDLRAKGYRRATQFGWRDAAVALAGAYRDALS